MIFGGYSRLINLEKKSDDLILSLGDIVCYSTKENNYILGIIESIDSFNQRGWLFYNLKTIKVFLDSGDPNILIDGYGYYNLWFDKIYKEWCIQFLVSKV